MQEDPYLTTGEIAAAQGVPTWMARRAIDALGEEIPRAGQYRLVPCRLVERVVAEIDKLRMTSRTKGTR